MVSSIVISVQLTVSHHFQAPLRLNRFSINFPYKILLDLPFNESEIGFESIELLGAKLFLLFGLLNFSKIFRS